MSKWLVLGAIALVAGMAWTQRPFRQELATFRTSVAERHEAQRHNIAQAASAMDGSVIEPGDTWSFNGRVGPRTPERGFIEAPAYLEGTLTSSAGGGVCQVSSTLYNAAALAGLDVVERHAHHRMVRSVPPGRDATVWYGRTDLRLQNPYPFAVRLQCSLDEGGLSVKILGSPSKRPAIRLRTVALPSSQGERVFRTLRQVAGDEGVREEILSDDRYHAEQEGAHGPRSL